MKVQKIEELLLSAKEALVKKNIEKSIGLFTEVLKIDPINFSAIFSRGTAYFLTNQYQDALVDFTRGISLKPDSSRLYCSRGNTYLALNQTDSAFNDLNQAIELDPQYPSAYFCRSEVFNRIGEKQLAEADQ